MITIDDDGDDDDNDDDHYINDHNRRVMTKITLMLVMTLKTLMVIDERGVQGARGGERIGREWARGRNGVETR